MGALTFATYTTWALGMKMAALRQVLQRALELQTLTVESPAHLMSNQVRKYLVL